MFKLKGSIVFNVHWMAFVWALLFIGTSEPARGDIYRWVDDKGRVHFGDKDNSKRNSKKASEKIELRVAPSNWQRFDIKVTSIDVRLTDLETQQIISDVNNVYEFFDTVMYFDFFRTVPVNITIVKNKKKYGEYLQKTIGKNLPSRGMYISKNHEIVLYMRKNRKGTLATIKHETSHAIIDSIAPNTPAWLNEGLAEQMETLEREDMRLVTHQHKENRSIINRVTMLPLREMLDLKSRKWRDKLATTDTYLQAQAGEFVFFLLATTTRKSFVTSMLQEYKRGSRMRSLYLVRDNYIGDVGGMEVEWVMWLKRNNTTVVRF